MSKTFLKENKRLYHLQFNENSIHGRVGFSFTAASIQTLLVSLYNYCSIKCINKIFVGSDSSEWAYSFYQDIILKTLKTFGITCVVADRPSTLPEFVWLIKEASDNKKTLGLYLSSDCHESSNVSVFLYNNLGQPVSRVEIQEMCKMPCTLKTYVTEDVVDEEPDSLSLEFYLKYLSDKKELIDCKSSKTINIDTMYGASETVVSNLNKYITAPINVFNRGSEKPRINKYIPKPTGPMLKWYTTHPSVGKSNYFFGIDGDGDSLGLYDLEQDLELNSSSIAILLLKSLKTSNPDLTGTVVISKMLSFKVEKLATLYGLDVVKTESHLEDIPAYENVIFYADECGRFYFGAKEICGNPYIAIQKIVYVCETLQKSPGNLVDLITSTEIKKLSYFNKIVVPTYIATMDSIINLLKAQHPKAKVSGKVLRELKIASYTRCIFKENKEEGLTDIYIESNVKDLTIQLGKIVTDYLKENSGVSL